MIFIKSIRLFKLPANIFCKSQLLLLHAVVIFMAFIFNAVCTLIQNDKKAKYDICWKVYRIKMNLKVQNIVQWYHFLISSVFNTSE